MRMNSKLLLLLLLLLLLHRIALTGLKLHDLITILNDIILV
jgi:hypothetical protein